MTRRPASPSTYVGCPRPTRLPTAPSSPPRSAWRFERLGERTRNGERQTDRRQAQAPALTESTLAKAPRLPQILPAFHPVRHLPPPPPNDAAAPFRNHTPAAAPVPRRLAESCCWPFIRGPDRANRPQGRSAFFFLRHHQVQLRVGACMQTRAWNLANTSTTAASIVAQSTTVW